MDIKWRKIRAFVDGVEMQDVKGVTYGRVAVAYSEHAGAIYRTWFTLDCSGVPQGPGKYLVRFELPDGGRACQGDCTYEFGADETGVEAWRFFRVGTFSEVLDFSMM